MDFQINPNLIDELTRGAEMGAAMLARAEVAAEAARATAPVGSDEDPHPGQFRDSIHAALSAGVALVYTDDPVGNIIEFGSSDTPAHATLRRAVEATVGPVVGGH